MTLSSSSDLDRGSLRIAFVTTFYPPWNRGGDGILVQRLAEALVRRGHRVTIVHDVDAYETSSDPPPDPRYRDDPRIRHRSIGGTPATRLDLLLSHQAGRPVLRASRLREAIEGEPFDVVHFHNVSLLGGPGVLRYGDAIRLCTLNDYWFVCPMHVLWRLDREACTRRTCVRCTLAGRRPPQVWRYTGTLPRVVDEIGLFLTGSEFARDKHYEHGFPASIEVLPPFVPEDEIAPRGPGAGTEEEDPFFLFVGRLERYKGAGPLIEIFRRFRRARLVIVGGGPLEGELRRRAADLGHVEMTGPLPRGRVSELYRRATAVIVPSLCYETFGLVAVEALAQATPVIVRDGGALREVVERTGGGVVYGTEAELEAALETALDDPDRRRKTGLRGRRSVIREFSEEAHLSRYLALVGELLDRRAGPIRETVDG